MADGSRANPTQPGTLLSLAPAVLFGSRFSSEEKWDERKVKETKTEP